MTIWADEAADTDPVPRDPYETLGIAPTASDAEVRRAYHRLAKLHHPDRNGGSEPAARRFSEIQAAHSLVLRLRREGLARTEDRPHAPTGGARPQSPRHTWAEPWLEDRIAAFERGYETQRDPQPSERRQPPAPGARAADPDSLRRRLTDLFRNS